MANTTMTFASALKKELMPNATATEFMGELKSLTPADREWYTRELENAGYIITAPVAVPAQ